MKTLDIETQAIEFYKERYGVSIISYPYPLKKSLENLYFRGVRLKPSALYRKLNECGIELHRGVLLRTRMATLVKRVPQEPPLLTVCGARAWHKMVLRPFVEPEVFFMLRNFYRQTLALYPSLDWWLDEF